MLHLLAGLFVLASAAVALGQRPATAFAAGGRVSLSLGFLLVFAYTASQLAAGARLPKITGYLLAGALAGPFLLGFVPRPVLLSLRFMDDLAFGVIALAAGGEIHLAALRQRRRAVLLNMAFQPLLVFSAVFLAVFFLKPFFADTRALPPVKHLALSVLLGISACALSPASAIAIVSETRAKGPYTDTLMSVTVALDVVVIVLFTAAITLFKPFLSAGAFQPARILGLVFALSASSALGLGLGRLIALYMERAGHNLLVFLACFAFGTAKCAHWLAGFTAARYGLTLHLEPLLICMAAGFYVNNSAQGPRFMDALSGFSLPVYVLFFSLAGASLDLGALAQCWPLALTLAGLRVLGLAGGAGLAGALAGDPPRRRRVAWMGYVSQAGVSIGLAKIAERQFPELGGVLVTVVLAMTAVNQLAGPVLFKSALARLGEAGGKP
jgi:Kef-type K+ transport system membrane component KefB